MNAILSIKPQFVEKIKTGKKRYEYRKSVFKRPVQKVYIYASAPVSKIIGEFEPVDIIMGDPEDVWKKTKAFSGITKIFFDSYYKGRNMAFALEIKNLRIYERVMSLPAGIVAPQSFRYVDF